MALTDGHQAVWPGSTHGSPGGDSTRDQVTATFSMTLQTAEHRGQLSPSCGGENRSHGSALSFKAGGRWILADLHGPESLCNASLRADNAAM